MNYVYLPIIGILLISNIVFIYFLKKKSKEPELTKDANQLLSELLSGGAVVTVQIANRSDVFQWSPKDV